MTTDRLNAARVNLLVECHETFLEMVKNSQRLLREPHFENHKGLFVEAPKTGDIPLNRAIIMNRELTICFDRSLMWKLPADYFLMASISKISCYVFLPLCSVYYVRSAKRLPIARMSPKPTSIRRLTKKRYLFFLFYILYIYSLLYSLLKFLSHYGSSCQLAM